MGSYDQSSFGLKCLPVISPPLEETVDPHLFMSCGRVLQCFPLPAGSHCSPARGACSDASSHRLGTLSSIRSAGSLTRADHQPIFVAVEIAVVLQSFFASSGFIFFINTTLSKQQARP